MTIPQDPMKRAALLALAEPAVRERLTALGALPLGTPRDVFAAFVERGRHTMAELVREANITLQ